MTFRSLRASAGLALIVAAASIALAQQPQTTTPAQPAFNPRDVIPFDAAVRTATLPNGLKLFVRHNDRPAKRVSLRLAVKAGSLNEADDQRGLAHLIEHMAFNGGAHFKPGELVAYFESIGSRLGPHVNAYTSFDETVYMLELPTDRPGIVAKGLDALSDFAGGLTLDPVEIDKERGVVIEEWRLGLGANSRIRDKQFPIIFAGSRYAERLPIGKPEVVRNAPAARLRAFYDTWYRPDHMAVVVVGDVDASGLEQDLRAAFSPLKARRRASSEPDRKVPVHKELLVNIATDPELTQSSVSIQRKRPRESGQHVADYRRDLVERLVDRMISDRLAELVRRPDATMLGAGAGSGSLSLKVATFTLRAAVQEGRIKDGLTTLAIEARRVRQYGFNAAELDRAKRTMLAFYERAYSERDKTDSGSFAQEYLNYFLESEPSPGIEYERRLVQQTLPAITLADVSAMARTLLEDDSRVLLATTPQKAGAQVPSDGDLRATLASSEKTAVTAWNDDGPTGEIVANKPTPAAISARRELPAIGVTVVKFANGVEAWLKPTDFKNDQVLFSMEAPGGGSLAAPGDFEEASLASTFVGAAGVGGFKPVDLQRALAGKLASASPYIGLSSHGISGSAAPADLETALQLLYQHFMAPNDNADAIALIKRQLGARAANRDQSPQQVFGERLAQVNSANHYTSRPLTVERVAALDGAKMLAYYRQRFSNAVDFTFFMVGAFKIDEAVPLVARYVGSLPSPAGQPSSRVADIQLRFPAAVERVVVEKGREPRSQTVMSFFADPSPNLVDQEQASAAATVLEISLRDILREELGQTYSVGVGLAQPLPQRGAGSIQVRFGSAPENAPAMIERVLTEIRRLQKEGPSADWVNRTKESARRTYETSLRENSYWIGRLTRSRLLETDTADIVTRAARIDAITPEVVQSALNKYFPLDRYTVVTLVPAKSAE